MRPSINEDEEELTITSRSRPTTRGERPLSSKRSRSSEMTVSCRHQGFYSEIPLIPPGPVADLDKAPAPPVHILSEDDAESLQRSILHCLRKHQLFLFLLQFLALAPGEFAVSALSPEDSPETFCLFPRPSRDAIFGNVTRKRGWIFSVIVMPLIFSRK